MNAAEAGDAAGQPIRCPKCQGQMPGAALACGRCGLLKERFARFIDQEQAARLRGGELDPFWQACMETWQQPVAHDRILDQAARLEMLPDLARRYRDVLLRGPDPVADKRLKQIAVLLEHALRAQAREHNHETGTWAARAVAYCVAAGFLSLSLWVVYMVMFRRR